MTIHRKVWQGGDPPHPIETRSADPPQTLEGETAVATHSDPLGTGPQSEPTERPEPTSPPSASAASRRVAVVNGLGFHLRPIERFVAVVKQFRSEVEVRYDGKTCNGQSILDLLSLVAECGAELELAANGVDAREVLDALADLFASRFDEDDLGQPLPRPSP